MMSLPLKASRNEQRAVIRCLWANRLSANGIYSQMRPVYGHKCCTRRTIYVWCQKFSCGRESVVDDEQVVATTDSLIAAVDSFNEFARCVEK